MNFIFQGCQKKHVSVAISQKGLVNFFRYAHQIKAFFIPVHTPVSLFMGRFFPLEFHSGRRPSRPRTPPARRRSRAQSPPRRTRRPGSMRNNRLCNMRVWISFFELVFLT